MWMRKAQQLRQYCIVESNIYIIQNRDPDLEDSKAVFSMTLWLFMTASPYQL